MSILGKIPTSVVCSHSEFLVQQIIFKFWLIRNLAVSQQRLAAYSNQPVLHHYNHLAHYVPVIESKNNLIRELIH